MTQNSKYLQARQVLALLALIIGLSGLHEASAQAVLSTKLEVIKAKVATKDRLDVRFVVTNTSSDPVHVLTWLTPLEPFNSEVFLVTRNGEPVDYIGRLVKRGAPTEEDYVTVAPGKSVSHTLDLAEAYAIYNSGDYKIQLRTNVVLDVSIGTLSSIKKDKSRFLLSTPILAEPVFVHLLERRKAPKLKSITAEATGVPTFEGCSLEQKDNLLRATSAARLISGVARNSLLRTSIDVCPGARRYTMWFGTATAQRYKTVSENFTKINNALETQNLAFNCKCNQANTYAYVYPNQPYKIWLCGAFWRAPTLGTDSRAGTLVHEVSHFTVVAGTKDLRYGQASCKKLAQDDPAKAITNADSHEYYAEDTPPTSMP
jgi:peptidyl-Lys metalloendopeptidase